MIYVKKPLKLSIYLLLTLAISIAFATISAAKDLKEIEKNVLRLHITANSDSAADQELKLKVRDEVLKATSDIFEKAENADDAAALAESNINLITETANKVIAESGFDYGASAAVATVYFPTKEYEGNIKLPAGEYRALRIALGSGKGKNWWCVMFPPVCLSGSIKKDDSKKMTDVLSGGALELTKPPKTSKAKIRFKSVEIINGFFNMFRKR